MNCNYHAFMWVVDVIKVHTNYQDEHSSAEEGYHLLNDKDKQMIMTDRMLEINDENCLNKLVTSHFLRVTWLYERIWSHYFRINFTKIVN